MHSCRFSVTLYDLRFTIHGLSGLFRHYDRSADGFAWDLYLIHVHAAGDEGAVIVATVPSHFGGRYPAHALAAEIIDIGHIAFAQYTEKSVIVLTVSVGGYYLFLAPVIIIIQRPHREYRVITEMSDRSGYELFRLVNVAVYEAPFKAVPP